MTDCKEKQNTKKSSSPNESTRFSHISADLQRLRERPESRRGPFIISDEDLNNQFDLEKNTLID